MGSLEAGLVRILNPDGSTAGTGFFVRSDLIATCAHVLHSYYVGQEIDPGEIRVAPTVCSEEIRARVVPEWLGSSDTEDVAFLRISPQTTHSAFNALPIYYSKDSASHRFETFGFPGMNSQGGMRAFGQILGAVQVKGSNVLQVRSQEVTPGFSGAPVWDADLGRVVGMIRIIAAPDEYGRLGETAFATPLETLRHFCPELELLDICPYRGLLPFTYADAKVFFGRDDLIEEMIGQLRRNPRFLAIVGSSGSGKSSAVQAGLIPRLRSIPGFENATVVTVRPGSSPYREFRKAMVAAGATVEADSNIPTVLSQFTTEQTTRVVMFCDQFEELFALSIGAERQEFISTLVKLLDSSVPATIVITLRADFYDQLLRSTLGQHTKAAQITVLPMGTQELRDAIVRPAAAMGFELEPGLLERILEEAVELDQPLPLLEFALTQLWRRKRDQLLTHAAYSEIGKVVGALTLWANDAYQVLVGEQRAYARRLFTSLVHFGKGGAPDTRRRLRVDDIGSPETNRAAWDIVQHFVEHRLLVIDRETETGTAFVEIVHDALLTEWEMLRGWISDDRPFLSWRQMLDERIQEWHRNQNDLGALLRGALLSEAQRYFAARPGDFSLEAEQYIRISSDQQIQEELRLKTLNAEAELQRSEAEKRMAESQKERQVSIALNLASQSDILRSQQSEAIDRSLLLAVESVLRHRTLAGDQALRRALELLPRAIARLQHEDEVRVVAFSPNRRWLGTGTNDGTAIVWDIVQRRELLRISHGGEVTGLAFNHDGTLLATSSTDSTVRVTLIKDASAKNMVHDFQVYSVCFSTDGRRVLSASMDRTARVWDVSSGIELCRLTHNDQVRSAIFDESAERIATASWDGVVRIWNAADGRELASFPHDDLVGSIMFVPFANRIASACNDGIARIWNLDSRDAICFEHEAAVAAISISSDGKLLATGSWDRTARIWELDTRRERTRVVYDGNVNIVAFSPDAKLFAVGGLDQVARLFDVATGRELSRMGHADRLHTLGFSADSRLFSTGAADRVASIWEIGSGSECPRLVHEDGIYDLVYSPDGKRIATASIDGTGRVWDAASGRELLRLKHDGGVNAIRFSPDGRLLATGGMDCTVRVWDAESGKEIFRREHELMVYSLAFGPDGRTVSSCSMDYTARVWDSSNGRSLFLLNHADQVDCVSYSPTQALLATGSRDGSVRLWDLREGTLIRELVLKYEVQSLAFSPDGMLLASGSQDRTVRIWGVQSGCEQFQLHHEDRVPVLKFSADGHLLFTASWDRTARIWDAYSGKEMKRLRHEDQVCTIDVDVSGEFVATAGWDRTARIWERRSGLEIARVGHSERIHSLTFSPDGKLLATASMDGTAQIWLWRADDLVAECAKRLTRNLTVEEWGAYLPSEPYRKTCPNLQ